MEKTTSDISDSLGLCLVQGRHGWSDLLCFHRGRITECRVSEVFSNPVFEMIRLCRAILENRHEIVTLHDEPGGSRLSVTPDIQMQHIILFEVRTFESDETEEEKPPVLSVRIKRKQLLSLLMTELWKLYRFHKELSFQRDRPQFSSADALLQLNAEWDNHPHLGPSLLK